MKSLKNTAKPSELRTDDLKTNQINIKFITKKDNSTLKNQKNINCLQILTILINVKQKNYKSSIHTAFYHWCSWLIYNQPDTTIEKLDRWWFTNKQMGHLIILVIQLGNKAL